jgi:hypothetical protein
MFVREIQRLRVSNRSLCLLGYPYLWTPSAKLVTYYHIGQSRSNPEIEYLAEGKGVEP